jgi:hypothetical protein
MFARLPATGLLLGIAFATQAWAEVTEEAQHIVKKLQHPVVHFRVGADGVVRGGLFPPPRPPGGSGGAPSRVRLATRLPRPQGRATHTR